MASMIQPEKPKIEGQVPSKWDSWEKEHADVKAYVDSGRREPLQNKKDVKKIKRKPLKTKPILKVKRKPLKIEPILKVKRKPLKTEPVQLEEPEVFVLDTNVIIDCNNKTGLPLIQNVESNVVQKLKKKKRILICDVIIKEAEKKKIDYSQIEKLYGKNRVEKVVTTSVRKAAENLESKYELLHSPDSVLLALAIKEKYGIITNDSALADSCDKENVYVYDPRQPLTPSQLRERYATKAREVQSPEVIWYLDDFMDQKKDEENS